jgi:hypothetical protein
MGDLEILIRFAGRVSTAWSGSDLIGVAEESLETSWPTCRRISWALSRDACGYEWHCSVAGNELGSREVTWDGEAISGLLANNSATDSDWVGAKESIGDCRLGKETVAGADSSERIRFLDVSRD